MTRSRAIADGIKLFAAIVSLTAFFTGFSSFPNLLGIGAADTTFSIDVAGFFGWQGKIIIVLLGSILFVMLETWFVIGSMEIFIRFLKALNVDVSYRFVYYGLTLLVLLFCLGLNMLYMMILFGGFFTHVWVALLGTFNIFITWIFFRSWFYQNAHSLG